MTAQERMEVLRGTPLFGNASAESLKLLAGHAVERHLNKGEVLLVGGEIALGLYAAVSGALRAFMVNEAGREQTIHVERAGGTFAEIPVFDNGPDPSTVMPKKSLWFCSWQKTMSGVSCSRIRRQRLQLWVFWPVG